MDGTKTTTNWIIAGLVALVVIIGGGWLIARERSGTLVGANATSTESSTTETASTGSSSTNPTPTPSVSPGKTAYVANPIVAASGQTVSVADQPAGSNVTIADVSVSQPTWVAVRDTTHWYPGAKLISKSAQNVMIPLLRNTVAGKTYEVVLFTDNGDGKFSIHGGDNLVTGADGAPVSATFKAQ